MKKYELEVKDIGPEETAEILLILEEVIKRTALLSLPINLDEGDKFEITTDIGALCVLIADILGGEGTGVQVADNSRNSMAEMVKKAREEHERNKK